MGTHTRHFGGSYKVDRLGTPALARQPVFLPKKNGLSPGVGRTTRFFTKKKRVVKPIFKKNGLLTRFFTKKKRAVSFADYSPFFFGKKTG